MENITKNEMLFILNILKNPENEYNASSISKVIGISSMGALKIARKLEKEKLIISRQLGKAKFYKINFNNEYTKQYVIFLLKREAEQSSPYVKRWIFEINKIKNAKIAILFGSVLNKQERANDIDVLLISEQKKFSKLKKEIEEINFINVKKLHPIYQSKGDFSKNIKRADKVILSAIKGVVVFGEDIFLKLVKR